VARDGSAPEINQGATKMDAGRTVRLSNTAVVLTLILKSGPISVREISERAGLSKVTTHAIIQELGDRNLVEIARHDHARRGPAAAMYAARADAAYAISASVDAETAVAECVDLRGVSRAQARVEGGDPIKSLVHAIRQVEHAPAETVVIGLPYALAADAARLLRALGRPADIRSNVELACRAEAASQDTKTFVYASLAPEPAVAAVAAGRTYTGPTSLLTRSTLAEVVATTCAVFDTPVVVGDLGDLRIAGGPRMVASRAGVRPAAHGARALALSRLRQAFIDRASTAQA
jgi:DNA-binding IscR family transcriptional regulator